MSNMGLKSKSIGNNRKKVEKMRNYLSDGTVAFTNMKKMGKN